MKVSKNSIVLLGLLLSLFLSSCGVQSPDTDIEVESKGETMVEVFTPEPTLDGVQSEQTPIETISLPTQRIEFGQLGISLEIPSEFCVIKSPEVNFEDQSKLNSYTFYIQNYGCPGGVNSGTFQMYGLLQYISLPISWELFSNTHIDSPTNAYATYFEVGGLRGYDTQLTGERNRFIYYLYLDGYVLAIAVGEPTTENKMLADQIIQSLEFSRDEFGIESHVKLVTDSNQLFQLLLPEDWEFAQLPTIGLQLSILEANSPDLEVIVQEGAGHSDIYYKKGISLYLQVIEDDAAYQINWPDLKQYDVYYDGILGTVSIFTEPSTAEGEIRSVHIYHEGKTYILRFAYANDANRDVLDFIISSFIITPESFYPIQ